MNVVLSIYTYKTLILCVCLSLCVFTFSEPTKSPSFMKFWLKASFGPGWNITKPDFRNSDFYGFYGHFSCFLKCVFVCFFAFFSKISAILTPRTMKFGHIKQFCTKKWHKKKFRKISIFRAFFRCSFYTQIQK